MIRLIAFGAPLCSLALFFSSPARAAAPSLSFGETGISVERGADFKASLSLPQLVDANKSSIKILEKTISGNTAILKYANGAQMEVELGGGELVFKPVSIPDGTKTLHFTMKFDAAPVAGGGWKFDSKSGIFSAGKSASVTVYQGTARNVAIADKFQILLPAPAFQQLQDLRSFQKNQFFWKCWLPYSPGERLAVQFAEGPASGAPPSPPADGSSPAAATPPKPSAPSPKMEDKEKGTRILKWKDGKRAAFMLAFDDSCPTHLKNAIPELEKRKLVGNFYVVTGNDLWNNPASKAKWEEAAKSPYVALQNHTFRHKGAQTVEEFDEDVVKCNEAIYAITPHLKNPRLIGFGQPGGVPWKISKEEIKEVLKKHHMANRPWFAGPPLTMKSLAEVLATVDAALAKGEMGHVDFHGVGGDWHSAPMEWFTALLDKLEAEKENLWVTDVVSWYQYQGERKNSELKILQSSESEVRASLACTLDPVYFDLPLTVAVEVPASWKQCHVSQGAKTMQVEAAGGEVRFDALPGPDEIVIKPP